MAPAIVSSIGLALDIAGVVLLWWFGLPAQINRTGARALLLEQPDEAQKAKAKEYDKWSRCGLWLLIGGFALQLLSNWIA